MENQYELLANKIISDVKKQFEEGYTTDYGEPQAYIKLENGRSIEITHEQEDLPEDEYYYSVKLNCNSAEYDDKEYSLTDGVIDQYASSYDNEEELLPLIISALKCNEKYPPRDVYLPDRDDINSKLIVFDNIDILTKDVVDKSLQSIEKTGKKKNKWEQLFDSFLELTEFRLVKNETYKAIYENQRENFKEYVEGYWSLNDLQGGNLGNICGERFDSAAQILDRMDIYIEDYIVIPLQEIRKIDEIKISGYKLYEDMNWSDYVVNRELFREDYQIEIDYLDMICNHADEINLNNCSFEYRNRGTSLEWKISNAQDKVNGYNKAKSLERIIVK